MISLQSMQSCAMLAAGYQDRQMASLTIRQLDDDVKRRLRLRAARHGRSMEEEARHLLALHLAAAAAPATPQHPTRPLAEAAPGTVLKDPGAVPRERHVGLSGKR